MCLPNALRQYVVTSLTALRRMRWHSIRARAVLLVLVALLNTAQGIVCNFHDTGHISVATAQSGNDGLHDLSHDHASALTEQTDPSDPLNIEAHCLHVSCVHSPAFAASPMAHEFLRSSSAVPATGAQLYWPMPPLGANFRPPIAA